MSFADPRAGRPGRPAFASAYAGRPAAAAPPVDAAAAPPRAAPAVDRLVVGFVTLDLVLMMLLQKFALPLSGDSQVSMLLLTHYGVLGALLFARRAVVDATRLATYGAFLVAALFGQIVADRSFGPTSLLLAAAIYGALVVVLPINRATHRSILASYQWVVVGVCLLVFLDHAIQLTGQDMPNIEKLQPDATIYHEYVYIQPLYWSSPYSKPNAIFLLEASVTSQLIAIALVLEVALFQRLRFLMLYGCALIATFAGTGLLLVLLASPFLLPRLKPALIAAGVAVAVVALGLAAASGWFEVVAKRLDEHEHKGSSANARFVAPVEIVAEVVGGEPEAALFGLGAGNIERRPGVVWMPFAKVIVEYGLIVFVVWLAFFSHAILSTGVPFIAAWLALVQFHLLNGSFLVPLDVYLCVVLAAGYRIARDDGTPAPIPLARPAARPVIKSLNPERAGSEI
jgi:hypothetical protein